MQRPAPIKIPPQAAPLSSSDLRPQTSDRWPHANDTPFAPAPMTHFPYTPTMRLLQNSAAHSGERLCPYTMGDMPNHYACNHAPAVKIKAHGAPCPIKIPPKAAPPLCALRFALCPPPLPCAAGHTKIPRPCQAGDFFLYQNTSFSTMVCSRDGPTLMMPRGTPMSLEISSR